MRLRTDDEIYRVNAVWLGPPKATFPWQARYVAYGVGILIFLAVLTLERQIGIGVGFFSTAWALVITIGLTKFLCSRITHDRPLSAVTAMWLAELRTPRPRDDEPPQGSAVAARVRVTDTRPAPRPKRGHQ